MFLFFRYLDFFEIIITFIYYLFLKYLCSKSVSFRVSYSFFFGRIVVCFDFLQHSHVDQGPVT